MKIGSRHALFIDFDGTLVDLAPHPSAILVPAGLEAIVARLHRALDGAVAIVTGRPIAEIDRFLRLPEGMPVAGVHGAELRVGGHLQRTPPAETSLAAMRLIAEGLAQRHPALYVEYKPVALAVHYRAEPALGGLVHDTLAAAVRDHPDLKLMRGHAVSEVKPAWADKGAAVSRLLRDPVFAGRTPVMIGDDVTDEDGFRVALEAGGSAIKVGPGETLAPERLADPRAVREWLARTLEELCAPG